MIIDAPTDILGARLPSLAPPRVLLGSRVDKTENIAPSMILEKIRQPLTLLGEEARIFDVPLPVLEVNLLVSNVHVAAKNDASARGFELVQVL